MIELDFALLGVAIGVLVAAPVGPVNVMTLQRTLRYGFLPGFSAGVGAALADVIFATAAAFGLTAIRNYIEGHSQTIQLIGGCLVILFGLRILISHPHIDPEADGQRRGALGASATAFAMTITNPGTIFGFIALFGALGDWGPDEEDWVGTGWLVLGVALGTLGWWSSIAAVAGRLRMHLTDHTLEQINHVAGTFLILFGVAILGRLGAIWLGLL